MDHAIFEREQFISMARAMGVGEIEGFLFLFLFFPFFLLTSSCLPFLLCLFFSSGEKEVREAQDYLSSVGALVCLGTYLDGYYHSSLIYKLLYL